MIYHCSIHRLSYEGCFMIIHLIIVGTFIQKFSAWVRIMNKYFQPLLCNQWRSDMYCYAVTALIRCGFYRNRFSFNSKFTCDNTRPKVQLLSNILDMLYSCPLPIFQIKFQTYITQLQTMFIFSKIVDSFRIALRFFQLNTIFCVPPFVVKIVGF